MSVKFVSKNTNFRIVLKQGMEGNRAIGTQAIPGLYVKFDAGVVDVKEEKIIKMMREHSGYGKSFVEVKEGETDPYIDDRPEIEPAHFNAEVKYGRVGKNIGRPPKMKLTPQLKKVIEGEAIKMIPSLLKSNPKILEKVILGLAAEIKTGEQSPKKKDVEGEDGEAVLGQNNVKEDIR